MLSQPARQIIAMHILLNISRRKSIQAIKFGLLIEHIWHKKVLFWKIIYKI